MLYSEVIILIPYISTVFGMHYGKSFLQIIIIKCNLELIILKLSILWILWYKRDKLFLILNNNV